MPAGVVDRVLDALGVGPRRVSVLKDVPGQNASWLVQSSTGEPVVLRRYHPHARADDLAYEHQVLRYLADAGWVVPVPLSDLVQDEGLCFCLTRFVPGQPAAVESPAQQRRRGRDQARLHLALRGLAGLIGQRPGWLAQHESVTVHTDVDWPACVRALSAASPRLAERALAAADRTRTALAAIGAESLPVTVVHGDFARWNVHYQNGRLAGVIDFGLTHLDSRPYELAIARADRAPPLIEAYRDALAAGRWPLSDLEEAAIGPVSHAFRLDQVAWLIHDRLPAGPLDLAAIERQLARTGEPALPGG